MLAEAVVLMLDLKRFALLCLETPWRERGFIFQISFSFVVEPSKLVSPSTVDIK